jgi:hypothetical protein
MLAAAITNRYVTSCICDLKTCLRTQARFISDLHSPSVVCNVSTGVFADAASLSNFDVSTPIRRSFATHAFAGSTNAALLSNFENGACLKPNVTARLLSIASAISNSGTAFIAAIFTGLDTVTRVASNHR